uniref:Uncharacterized protein n=1 Tax=mine drainage metagenome TaxID=410659 RepID=E6PKR4_9ZZZZ
MPFSCCKFGINPMPSEFNVFHTEAYGSLQLTPRRL